MNTITDPLNEASNMLLSIYKINPEFGSYVGLNEIENAKLKAIKIGEEEFTEDIIAQMILCINNSKLVIADLTGQRPCVYYDAGYAQAKSLRVIFTCREDEIDKVHFDVSHYPIVPGQMKTLKSSLKIYPLAS